MTSATSRQLSVLRFIQGYRNEHGFPPTIREIGDALGIGSTNGVNDHIEALRKKGFLTFRPQSARTFVPTRLGLIALGAGR